MPLMISTVCSKEGSLMVTGWNRRSKALSFSMCCRYSLEGGGADDLHFATGEGGL